MDLEHLKSQFLRRPRILWLVLGAMLLVSVLPLSLYHRQVLQLSQAKLTDTEASSRPKLPGRWPKKFSCSTPISTSN